MNNYFTSLALVAITTRAVAIGGDKVTSFTQNQTEIKTYAPEVLA